MVTDMTLCYSGEEEPAFVGTCHCCTDPWLRSPPPSLPTRRPPTPPSLSPLPSSPLTSHFHPSPISSGLLRPYKAVSRTNTRALTDLSLLRTAVSHLYEVSAHSEMRKEGRWRRHLLSLKNTSSILWQILQMFCNPEKLGLGDWVVTWSKNSSFWNCTVHTLSKYYFKICAINPNQIKPL